MRVWTEDDFKLSNESLRQVRVAERIDSLLRVQLPYGDRERGICVDLLVLDELNGTLKSYNIKRGNGSYDGGKKRAIHEEVVRTHMLLSDYGRGLGLTATVTHAHVVFYYGLLSLPYPWAVAGDQLDEHFGFPVHAAVEHVNAYFVLRLNALIEQDD